MTRPEPYLWRYREQFDDGEEMDLLLMMDHSGFSDEPGELTIIWWD